MRAVEEQPVAAPIPADVGRRPARPRAPNPRVWRGWLRTWAVLLVVLVAWEAAVRLRGISALVLPGPLRIWASLADGLGSGFFLKHIRATVAEILLGFGAGSALGIALGATLFHFPGAERVVRPYVVASQALPKLALAPLFILWFGFGLTPKVLITALIVFFPLFENMLAGLASPTREEVELFRALRAGRWQTFRHLRLPASLPYLFAGLRVAAILSVVGATVSEYAGANRGLGALIIAAQGTLDTAQMFAVFVLLTLIGLALYGAVALVERVVLVRGFARERRR
ncbi:MAG: ABC transporter permease [Chloroflexota bacterium]|nr:ABC transporter permease [Chloroflexota bacterium]